MPSWLRSIPPVTRNIIIINVIILLAEFVFVSFGDSLIERLGLHYWGADNFNPVQIFTYMFLHDNHSLWHILFNMFTLWMFGRMMEQVWGSRRFFVFYFVCGVGAGLVQEVVWYLTWQGEFISNLAALNHVDVGQMAEYVSQSSVSGNKELLESMAMFKNNYMVCIGASGAIFGVLLGFAFVFPNLPLYLFFIPVPIKAKYMVIGYAVLEFFLGVSGSGGTVAHFAHLGGMIFGLVMLLYWKHNGTLRGRQYF